MLTGILVAGCTKEKEQSVEQAPPGGYFETPFQSESQFIVDAIVSDLAEETYYAAHHELPDKKYFSVKVAEKPGSPVDAPVYELKIRLEPKQSDLKLELNVNGRIWSAEVYENVAAKLGEAVGLKAEESEGAVDAKFLEKLTQAVPETIEEQNQELSTALETDFKNPELHEKAAMLLGAFLLRERSGYFWEIRSPLSRMTAHLAMARFLGENEAGGR